MTKNIPNLRGILAVMGGVTAGLGIMYLFDPQSGGERRAAIRDKAVDLSNDVRKSVYATGADLKERAQDVIQDATARIPKLGLAPQPSPARTSSPQATGKSDHRVVN